MAVPQQQSRMMSVPELEARLEVLESRGVELEALVAAGTATPAERDELMRLQAEADFCSEVLEDMSAFGPLAESHYGIKAASA